MMNSATIATVPCRTGYPHVGNGWSARSARSADLRPQAYKRVSAAEPALEPCREAPLSLNLWQRYCLSLETNPTGTKAATSLGGFTCGDILAQTLEGGAAFDVARVMRLAAYGLLLDGPIGHMWYKWLDGTVDKTFHKNPKGTMAVGVKTAADQLVWAPIMTVVFFSFLKLLEGQPDMVWATVCEKTLPTVAANYVIWPAAHIISFKYVPSQQRILYNNSVAIFWNCYLSMIAADNGTAASGSPGWSWDAYSFWVGLPGGLDPGLFGPLSEMYQKAQSALGIHSTEPVGGVASDLSKMSHNLQSALGVHSPEPVGGIASDLSKMYHKLQSALGIHSPEPVGGLSAGATQMYHNLQSALGIHSPEPVGGLSALAHKFGAAGASAPHKEGLAGQIQNVTEMSTKAQEAVQGGMHESMLVGSFWLQMILQEAAQTAAHSQEMTMSIIDSLSHLHNSMP